jgi:hypothetical protein
LDLPRVRLADAFFAFSAWWGWPPLVMTGAFRRGWSLNPLRNRYVKAVDLSYACPKLPASEFST